MNKHASTPTTTELAFSLHSAVLHLMRRIRLEDDALGLSAPRLSALSTVAFGQERTIGEMAAMEQVRAPTMTRMVAALERDGLVRRRTDQRDKRLVRVRATAKGRALIERGRRQRVRFLERLLDERSPFDRETLARASAIMLELYERASSVPRRSRATS